MKEKVFVFFITCSMFLSLLLLNTEVYATYLEDSETEIVIRVPDSRIETLEQEINISERKFNVSIDGIFINDINAIYPTIIYNNIVYLPLDWINCKWLGISVNIGENNEIIIDTTGEVRSSVSLDYEWNINLESIEMGIITNEIIINGKSIDNTLEAYPIMKYEYPVEIYSNLIIQDSRIYFPLTWKWIVDEFGWFYEWHPQTGLRIQTQSNTDKLFLGQILSKINDFTFNKMAYISADVKSIETNESYHINLVKRTSGIRQLAIGLMDPEYLIKRNSQILYLGNESLTDNDELIVIEGSEGFKYTIYGYRKAYLFEHEYEQDLKTISEFYFNHDTCVDGSITMNDISISSNESCNIHQLLRDEEYIPEATPQYNLSDNIYKFEFLTEKNKVVSFEKMNSYDPYENYKIEYETHEYDYLNPKMIAGEENANESHSKALTKKTAVITLKDGSIVRILINDGLFEYDMFIDIIKI
ncbi:hypothetical protein EDC18_102338 [Natranaerovirga pectinivora]|uniref:Uncharacterized protein n=1 Tax=Natranaerovirga pectinivora TaxID=682400 RepID=A0A4R3MPW1_9FIRM|nr:hypothetical protein [Natranaerovirga pectinivora]TCT16321.1 hypothetical protein EDC18_102338 [Natranaerovirga pectinivora]